MGDLIDDSSSSDEEFIKKTCAKREEFFKGVSPYDRITYALGNMELGYFSPREEAALAAPEERAELFRRRPCANDDHHKCASCGSKDVQPWYGDYMFCNREEDEVITYHWAQTDATCGEYYYWTSP